jgi:hypothetical protein
MLEAMAVAVVMAEAMDVGTAVAKTVSTTNEQITVLQTAL